MAKLSDAALAAIDGVSPGLQLIAWYSWVAKQLDEDQRTLLSYSVSRLVNRGWLSPFPKLCSDAADALGLSAKRIDAAGEALVSHALIDIKDDRIRSLAAVISTTKTEVTYFLGEDHATPISLLGPIAALGIARGLSRGGEVVTRCRGSEAGANGKRPRIELACDDTGIHSRKPESVALFLPAWDGSVSPIEAVAGGGLFVDDDALAAWQTAHSDPDGMPLTSMFFPMAATDLGEKLGLALESMFDHVANYA